MTDDPAKMMNESATALAHDRKLCVFLDRILVFEKDRSAACEGIRKVWKEIKAAGFDETQARSRLVYRSIGA